MTSLRVTADLQLDVDGVGVRVDGDGSEVTVAVDDASALAAHLREVGDTLPANATDRRQAIARSVRALDDAGLTVTVSDPAGPLVRVGHGVRAGIWRLAGAGPHVQLSRRRESVSLALAVGRPSGVTLGARLLAVVAGVVAVGAGLRLGRSRARS